MRLTFTFSLSLFLVGAAGLFRDATESSGASFHHRSSKTEQKYLLETMGSGVAVFDFDNDGWMDLYFVNGAHLSVPQPDDREPPKTDRSYWNRLFRNKRNGSFDDVTEKYGVAGRGYGMGVAAADYDNDGFSDLLVTNYGSAILYRNHKGEKFEDVTALAGLKAEGWMTSAGFFDFDRDGDLDLFICRYLDFRFAVDRKCGLQTAAGRSYCHPDEYGPIANYLFANNGDGTFSDVSRRSGVGHLKGKALGVAFEDFNADGWLDIAVANDSVAQFLLRNNGNGTFSEIGGLAGVAYNDDGGDFAGMGIDASDLDQDGMPDLFITTLSLQSHAFFRNLGREMFDYRTAVSNLGRFTLQHTGWGLRIFDVDNDGRKEVLLVNGHVMDNIERTQPHMRYLQAPLLLRYKAGKFEDASSSGGAVLQTPRASRGFAAGDLNNDGFVDIVVSNSNGPALVAMNRATTGNFWIGLRLTGSKSNRDAIGAKVRLVTQNGQTQYAMVSPAGSYLSSHDPRVFFGLGLEEKPKAIEVVWPNGNKQSVPVAETNRIISVTEQ